MVLAARSRQLNSLWTDILPELYGINSSRFFENWVERVCSNKESPTTHGILAAGRDIAKKSNQDDIPSLFLVSSTVD
jgi:hypothetical protein